MTILLFIKPPACLAPNILLDSCRDRTAPPGHDHRHKTTARTAVIEDRWRGQSPQSVVQCSGMDKRRRNHGQSLHQRVMALKKNLG